MKYLIILLSSICCNVFGQDSVKAASANDRGKIYITVDRGVNWTRADVGLPSDASVNAWTTADKLVIAGTERHGVFISSDGMKSWYSSSKGLPRNTRILSIVYTENLIFVGTYLHGLFYSDDLGESWQAASNELTNVNIRVLYRLGRIIFAGTDAGLYISSNEGKSWKILLNGLQINSMTSEKNELFVATNKGVLQTIDLGMNWTWIFTQEGVRKLTCDSRDVYMLDFFGKVYKATKENYVWIKADIFLPFHYTFRITPAGSQFFTSDWNRSLRGVNSSEEVFWANGIPEDLSIKELLDTPFGVLAAVGNDGC